ncbi:MAG: hypothetical protein GC156_11200 [Actinomycetales bacterium]|nr:hypothetical protein [Actinomycetales bacterium]
MSEDPVATDGDRPRLDRPQAQAVVDVALARVFAADVVSGLRADSPLSALAMTGADAVCLADAVCDAAAGLSFRCVIDDDAMASVRTIADLVDEVVRRSREENNA